MIILYYIYIYYYYIGKFQLWCAGRGREGEVVERFTAIKAFKEMLQSFKEILHFSFQTSTLILPTIFGDHGGPKCAKKV